MFSIVHLSYSKRYSVFFCIATPVSDPLEEYGDPILKELFRLCSQWSLGWGKISLFLSMGANRVPIGPEMFEYPRNAF